MTDGTTGGLSGPREGAQSQAIVTADRQQMVDDRKAPGVEGLLGRRHDDFPLAARLNPVLVASLVSHSAWPKVR